VEALFRDTPAPVLEPTLLAERRDATSIERDVEIPADLAYLEGHFDDFPVVPGVVQLRWALLAAASLLGAEPRVERIDALKFHELLRAGDRALLRVERASPEKLRFRLAAGDRLFASGRCTLATAAGDDA
jgi:3-hydroxymyristoyl/3-hydroxydecanoyl-(acyl carrier protein) dehydratase